jgi:hypothetical protein
MQRTGTVEHTEQERSSPQPRGEDPCWVEQGETSRTCRGHSSVTSKAGP